MTEYKNLKIQLDRYEAIIDSLKDLKQNYLSRGKQEEPEEEKKGE